MENKPMSAEEICKQFCDSSGCDVLDSHCGDYSECHLFKALTSFAEAKVKEANELNRREIECAHKIVDGMQNLSNHIKEIIAEQIERDAKLVEGTCGVDEFFSDQALAHRKHIAKQIRAQSGEEKA